MTKDQVTDLLKGANGCKWAIIHFKRAIKNIERAEDFVERGKAELAKYKEREKAAEKRKAEKAAAAEKKKAKAKK